MSFLTFYGGVNEIGGNKILLESGKSRIFLDFGMSFSRFFTYFDYFLTPRKLNGMGDFFEMGLLPKLSGIYRADYLKHMGMPVEQRAYNGVFITHAHADHVGYAHFLRADIPIYATPETFAIMESVEETSGLGWSEFVDIKKTFEFYKTNRGTFGRLQGEKAKEPRDLRLVDKPVEFDSLSISSCGVNHSLPGAVGYIIETENSTPATGNRKPETEHRIAYTGDLRFHGYGGHMSEKFIEKAKGVDTLIIEGTRLDNDGTITEDELQSQLSDEIKGTQGLVLANWPIRDTDRLISFFEAAKENGRVLAINTKQANLLEKLGHVNPDIPKTTDKNIKIFLTRKYWGLIDKTGLPDESVKALDYSSWERKYLDHSNMIDYRALKNNHDEYVVRCDFFDMTELIDIQPNEKTKYIRSTCEPFDDKMEFNERIVDAWLNHFRIIKTKTIHCSGHAPATDLKRIIEEIDPKTIIPIHTENPDWFKELGRDCIIPELEKQIKLG
jgi:ribonuclease J